MRSTSDIRVLQGLVGQAGQPWALSRALRSIGIESEAWSDTEHGFKYRSDKQEIPTSTKKLAPIMAALGPRLAEFDIIHFHTRSATGRYLSYPCLMDVCLLRAAGKRVYLHFRGSEVRNKPQFERASPYHYCSDMPHLFTPRRDAAKGEYVRLAKALASGIFVVDAELKSYVPSAVIVPRLIDESQFPHVGVSDRARPIVVHAPSNREIKGSGWVLKALDQLREEGLQFDLRLVEKMNHAEAAAAYRDADVVIDQFRIGWYGVLAVEAMAMGKPVVAYIRDDLWQPDLPIINANRDNLAEKLKEIILSASMRQEAGQKARAYYERVHAPRQVAQQLVDIYRSPEQPFDLQIAAKYLDDVGNWQARLSGKMVAFDALRDTMQRFGPLAASQVVWRRLAGRRP